MTGIIRAGMMTSISAAKLEPALNRCATDIEQIYKRCVEASPNYRVNYEEFSGAIHAAANKYLTNEGYTPSENELRQFINDLQSSDLYLAIACANGNEYAWWDFDAGYRGYIERIARHLASADTEAEEVLDCVYTELYGTRVVEGVRQSKFATYSGRGTLRGWLRAIVWHAVVDMHRARHDEISIDDWSETGGESQDRPGWQVRSMAGENQMLDQISYDRYRTVTIQALDASFASLDDHEKLLLLYYHVEGLKLREIARLVETPQSPLRRWFQRQSKTRAAVPSSRVHESTIMRWLEKVYQKVLTNFQLSLRDESHLSEEELSICLTLATEDLAADDIGRHLRDISVEDLSKDKTE
jgi:RNA polymerase sigma-70 factor